VVVPLCVPLAYVLVPVIAPVNSAVPEPFVTAQVEEPASATHLIEVKVQVWPVSLRHVVVR
jgi:hypothetical protein